jgi:3-deoxy-D-manno-octulosonic-acid transferase
MPHALYNALWYPALPFALLAAGARNAADRRQRLGRIDPALVDARGSPRLWLHAASVGEVAGVAPLVRALSRQYPELAMFATTMTSTGREAAVRAFPHARACMLAPLDWPGAVRNFLATIRPRLVVIAETELWPNFLTEPHRLDARVAIVNGRISERSFKRYRLIGSLIANALGGADLVLAQSSGDADRFVGLGAKPERVAVTGNTKYDLDSTQSSSRVRPELEAVLARRRILVAGSTAPGEDSVVIDAYRAMREPFPDLMLVLAPRHIERAGEVEDLLRRSGLPYLKATQLTAQSTKESDADVSVLLLDTLGELRSLYRHAAVAFVGGNLTPGRGGQNLGEPAADGVPVLFGPFHQNQIAMAEALTETGGGQVVADSNAFAAAAIALLADENLRAWRAQQARAAFERLGGAVERSLMHLRPLINL